MSIEKQPTFADLQQKGVKPEEMEAQGIAQDEAFKSAFLKSLRSWLVFWMGVFIIAAMLFWSETSRVFQGNFNGIGPLLEQYAMIIFLVAAILIYTSYVAGTRPLFPAMAYSTGSGAIQTELEARARMFNKLLGPVIGILIGIAFIIINQLSG